MFRRNWCFIVQKDKNKVKEECEESKQEHLQFRRTSECKSPAEVLQVPCELQDDYLGKQSWEWSKITTVELLQWYDNSRQLQWSVGDIPAPSREQEQESQATDHRSWEARLDEDWWE